MCRENPNDPSHLSSCQSVIKVIQNALPKCIFHAYKRITRMMTENVMFDRISPSQLHLIYREIT